MASTDKIEVPASLIDAINGLPDAVFLVMDDGIIIAANVAADDMFGYSHSQLIGSQVDELMPAGAREYHHKVRTDATSDRRLRQFTSGRTFESERRGGEVFQADIMLSPTRIDGVSAMWAIVRDLDKPSEANAGRQQVLGTLDAIGHMAASAFDLKDDFSKVAERLKEVIPHSRIGVALLCEDDPEMVEIAFLAGDDHPMFKEGERVPISSSATAWVVQTRARVSFTKAKTKFAPPTILADFQRGYTEFCGAPLFDGDSVIGMLMLSTREARGFSEFQKGLIDRLAEHLSVGIVNQRIRGRLQAKTREIESVGEIGKKISSSPDLDSALSAARDSISRLVPYDRLSISSIDLDEGLITGMFLDGEPLPGFDKRTHVIPDDAVDSMREMFATGGPILFDRETIVAIAESQSSFIPYRDAGYRWALIVPLQVTQTPVGTMIFGRKDVTGYTEDQIAVAGRIGEQLAGPVANAFHLTGTRDEARIESILAEIGTVVNTTIDLQEGEHELGALVRELVDNNSFTISSVTQDGMHLRWVYEDFSGIDRPADSGVGSVRPLTGTTAEQILQTREPVLVNAESWADFRKMYPGATPIRSGRAPTSVISVPLIASGEIFGFLTLRSVKRDAYSEADVAMSVRIGAQLAGSVALSELRRRDADLASERAVLATIGGLLASAVELSDVWAEFADLVSGLLPFGHISLRGIDTKAGQVRILNDSWTGNELPPGRKPGDVFPLSGTIAESVAATDQGVIFVLEDPEKLALEFPGTFPTPAPFPLPQALIGVPLAWGGETVAVLFVHSLESNRTYTTRDLRLVERVAAQIAGPVAGSLLRAGEAELTAEREVLAEIGSVMGAALDLKGAWLEFTDLLAKMIEFDRALLISIAPETQIATLLSDRSRTGHMQGMPAVGDSYGLKGTIAGHVAETQRTLSFGDETRGQLRKRFPASFEGGESIPWKSNLAVPLIWGGQVVAELGICHFDPGAYDDADQAIMERVAAQIAGPVAGSLLRAREAELAVEREALAQIGSVMGAALDLGEAWPEFAELLSGLLPFQHISLVGLDMSSSTVRVEQDWWASDSHRLGRIPGDVFPLGGTIAENLVSTRQGGIYSFKNSEQWERDYPGSQYVDVANPVRSVLAVPLMWGGYVVAALFIHNLEQDAYTQRDLRLAERVAARIAGPVAGALLRERDEALMRERATLTGIGELMGGAPDISSVFEEFAERVQQLVSFDRLSISEIDNQRGIVRRVNTLRGGTVDHDPLKYPLPGTMAERVVGTLEGLLLNFDSVEDIRSEFPGLPQLEQYQGAQTAIMVPVVWHGEAIIALSMGRAGDRPYGQGDLELLERVAVQIAGPVAGGILRAREEAQARERATLAEIGILMSSVRDFEEVFDDVAALAGDLLDFDAFALIELNDRNQTLSAMNHWSNDNRGRDEVMARSGVSTEGTLAGKAISERLGFIYTYSDVRQLKKDFPNTPMNSRDALARTTIAVPLIWGDQVVAVLLLSRIGDTPFAEPDLVLAERMATQIAGPVAGGLARQRELELVDERRRREAAELRATSLAELSETKNNFVSAMSHELRTPLTSIVAFSDILSRQGDKVLKKRQLHQVKVIQRNARRLEAMIDELLDLSRMESGRFEIVRSTFDFASMIAESLESSELQFEAMSQTVKFEIVTEVLPINGDRGRLSQVVNNLLGNASKYSPDGSEIEIEVTEEGGYLVVEIRDRGPGIQDDRAEELFEMFSRADDDLTRSVPGTGIGLHVAKRIIEEHGGEITIASREGGGATARFWIPTGVHVLP